MRFVGVHLPLHWTDAIPATPAREPPRLDVTTDETAQQATGDRQLETVNENP